jgi:hypothetical protein
VKHIRKRLTYANVMSSIAVFLILGGATAFAAKKIGSNQLKSNSVTTAKIKKNGEDQEQRRHRREGEGVDARYRPECVKPCWSEHL